MNTNAINCITNNFLVANSNWERNIEIIINLCVKQAEKSRITLLITSRSLLNLHNLLKIDKNNLNRIIIMYFDDIEKTISKLLELHIWTVIPSTVILDFDEFFCRQQKNPPTNQKISLLISSLLNYMKYLEKINDHLPISIVLVNSNNISENLIQILVDFYYNKSAYSDMNDLINVLPIIG